MIKTLTLSILFSLIYINTMAQNYNKLTEAETRVIINKGTEAPNVGEYTNSKDTGTYICKQCNTPLYRSTDKFDSHCGWPSFDDEIDGTVDRYPDPDGRRIEIVCANCDGHLGHEFIGEGFTEKNSRHCVNSISLKFIPEGENLPYPIKDDQEIAILASGCFWGTEYHLQKLDGVIETTVGYIGGTTKNPTYKEVCSKKSGHAEAVKVIFDPSKVSYETLLKLYFETHDPTQVDRQGPDIGDQYRSEIFYTNEKQKSVADSLITILRGKDIDVATEVTAAPTFYDAENYHQDYYDHKGSTPYCHIYRKLF